MIKLLSRMAWLLSGLVIGPLASADEERPLEVYNQGALARAFELPVLGETRVLGAGDTRLGARFDLTTEYYADSTASDGVVLDGETDLLTFALRHGFGSGLEATVEVPVMYQGGGFLDHTIEEWHHLFGLPNGGREEAPLNRYLYEYERNGTTLLDDHRSGADLGDIRIGAGWQALGSLAIRTEVKLASGDESHLAGGNNGLALWGDWALPFRPDSIFGGWLSAGGSYNGNTGVLHSMQNHAIPFGSLGLSLKVTDRIAVLTQFYLHGALYDGSQLDAFRDGLQLAMGGRYHANGNFDLDLGFQEDLITSSSPDFSLHMAVSWHPSHP